MIAELLATDPDTPSDVIATLIAGTGSDNQGLHIQLLTHPNFARHTPSGHVEIHTAEAFHAALRIPGLAAHARESLIDAAGRGGAAQGAYSGAPASARTPVSRPAAIVAGDPDATDEILAGLLGTGLLANVAIAAHPRASSSVRAQAVHLANQELTAQPARRVGVVDLMLTVATSADAGSVVGRAPASCVRAGVHARPFSALLLPHLLRRARADDTGPPTREQVEALLALERNFTGTFDELLSAAAAIAATAHAGP